jgi:DUF1365 family protein
MKTAAGAGAASALYVGHVVHHRLRPRRHALRYRVFTLLLDLDELPVLAAGLRCLSLDRWNLFSVHERDYGWGRAGLLPDLRRQLRDAGFAGDGPVRLLTMPRILGYAFNPLNVYFCHAADGVLEAVLYEVNNTYGERHGYLVEAGAPDADGLIDQACPKHFHVSPFLAADGGYAFRVLPPAPGRSRLTIRIEARDADGPVLLACHDAERRPLHDASLLRSFASHPLLTWTVTAGIHAEALLLWLKRLRVHPHPAPPLHRITVVKRQGPSA